MINSDFRRILIYFLILVVLQIPLLQNWVLFKIAFPFPYVGFILLLPFSSPRSGHMVIAFFIGLLMDIFSSTPGMHAAACVAVAYGRNAWLAVATDVADEDLDITIQHLGILRFLFFIIPLILVHHLFLFILENEGVSGFLRILSKSFWSTLLSSSIVTLAAMVAVRRKQRI